MVEDRWTRERATMVALCAVALLGVVPAQAGDAAVDRAGVLAATEWLDALVAASSPLERGRYLAADATYDATALQGRVATGRSEYLQAEDDDGTRLPSASPLYLDAAGAALLVGRERGDALVVLDVGSDGIERRTDLARVVGTPAPTYASALPEGGWPGQLWVLQPATTCPGAQLHGMVLDAAGRVTTRRTLRLSGDLARCGGGSTGWWVARPLPGPLGLHVTGTVETATGQVVVRNGSGRLHEALREEIARYARAGLDSPATTAVVFDPLDARCAAMQGWFDFATTAILVCADEDSICSDGRCWGQDALRRVLRHELAHAWVFDHEDASVRARLLGTVSIHRWNDPTDQHHQRGVEWAAEVLAWAMSGRCDETPATLRHPDPRLLRAAFTVLTGTSATSACTLGTA
jgi:hypothetical protein